MCLEMMCLLCAYCLCGYSVCDFWATGFGFGLLCSVFVDMVGFCWELVVVFVWFTLCWFLLFRLLGVWGGVGFDWRLLG